MNLVDYSHHIEELSFILFFHNNRIGYINLLGTTASKNNAFWPNFLDMFEHEADPHSLKQY